MVSDSVDGLCEGLEKGRSLDGLECGMVLGVRRQRWSDGFGMIPRDISGQVGYDFQNVGGGPNGCVGNGPGLARDG